MYVDPRTSHDSEHDYVGSYVLKVYVKHCSFRNLGQKNHRDDVIVAHHIRTKTIFWFLFKINLSFQTKKLACKCDLLFLFGYY